MTHNEQELDRWTPTTEAEKARVLDQLQRILASPGFLASKRYPALLRHVVEQSLAGKDEALKERLLGIEVFGRATDYDTNQDPVVRLSASEVRKRLAVYYQSPEHQNELVIGLNSGAYTPCFAEPQHLLADPRQAETDREEQGWLRRRRRRLAFWGATGLAFAVALFLCWGLAEVEDPQRNFWAPVLQSQSRVTLCAGSPTSFIKATLLGLPPAESERLLNDPALGSFIANRPKQPPTPLAPAMANGISHLLDQNGSLSLSHVNALIHIGAYLDQHHKPFRVELDSQSEFPQLREGPVVLIGAGDNVWTMRLTNNLRYGFGYQAPDQQRRIIDHKNPSGGGWTVEMNPDRIPLNRDYALVARYHDPLLDQPVVVVAGLSSVGTEAAAEFVARPEALRELLRNAPRAADKINVEAVLETQIIDHHAGPSHIVAIEYW